MQAWTTSSATAARCALRVNLRWIDIDTQARLDGNRIGTVNIDPLVYGVAYVHRF